MKTSSVHRITGQQTGEAPQSQLDKTGAGKVGKGNEAKHSPHMNQGRAAAGACKKALGAKTA